MTICPLYDASKPAAVTETAQRLLRGTMTAHIMLDLETWGKTPGSDIRSIGAVVFDPTATWRHTDKPIVHDGSLGTIKPFYVATDNPTIPERHENGVNIQGGYFDKPFYVYRKYPLTRDPDTVQWWNEQSAEAQAAFANPVDLREACQRFQNWLLDVVPRPFSTPADAVLIWANGPQFDASILDAVYRVVGLPVPWHYRAPRDMRTIADAAGMTRDDFAPFNHGTTHNALDDAISQARIVCEAYRRLGLRK